MALGPSFLIFCFYSFYSKNNLMWDELPIFYNLLITIISRITHPDYICKGSLNLMGSMRFSLFDLNHLLFHLLGTIIIKEGQVQLKKIKINSIYNKWADYSNRVHRPTNFHPHTKMENEKGKQESENALFELVHFVLTLLRLRVELNYCYPPSE